MTNKDEEISRKVSFIKKQKEQIEKHIAAKQNLTKLNVLFSPIKKYKAYKKLIKVIQMHPKVSLIIPVYNVEHYLEKCLRFCNKANS